MALLRELDPGEVGWAERVKPAERQAPRAILFHPGGTREELPLKGCATHLSAKGGFQVAIVWFLWWWGILGRRRVE